MLYNLSGWSAFACASCSKGAVLVVIARPLCSAGAVHVQGDADDDGGSCWCCCFCGCWEAVEEWRGGVRAIQLGGGEGRAMWGVMRLDDSTISQQI